MSKIFIFRHGQSLDNKQGIFSGWRDTDLSEEGVLEAQKIAEELKDESITKAYSSPQLRSVKTLEPVLRFHPNIIPITDERIKERNYGDLAGKSKIEVEKHYSKEYPLWHRSYDTAPPNGESIKDVETRVMSFLNELISTLKPTDVVVISAHGNSLRPMRRYFEKLTIEEMCSFEHEPGKIYSYEI